MIDDFQVGGKEQVALPVAVVAVQIQVDVQDPTPSTPECGDVDTESQREHEVNGNWVPTRLEGQLLVEPRGEPPERGPAGVGAFVYESLICHTLGFDIHPTVSSITKPVRTLAALNPTHICTAHERSTTIRTKRRAHVAHLIVNLFPADRAGETVVLEVSLDFIKPVHECLKRRFLLCEARAVGHVLNASFYAAPAFRAVAELVV